MLWLFDFCEDQIFVDFVGFLSMKIYVVLYAQCLRYNICSAWFLDLFSSNFYNLFSLHTLAWTCVLQFYLSTMLISFISQPCLCIFQPN